MKVMAFDPGTNTTGWSLFEDGNPVLHDKIRAVSSWKQSRRLGYMLKHIQVLIETHQPHIVLIEEQHVGRNPSTSLITARATGIVIALAALHAIPVYAYQPTEIKKAISGSGNASKEEVSNHIVRHFYNNKAIQSIGPFLDKGKDKNDDIYDAIALNYTHILYEKTAGVPFKTSKKKSTKAIDRSI